MQSGDAYAASKRAIHHALQLAVENEEMRSLDLRSLQSDYFSGSTKAFIGGRKYMQTGQGELLYFSLLRLGRSTTMMSPG